MRIQYSLHLTGDHYPVSYTIILEVDILCILIPSGSSLRMFVAKSHHLFFAILFLQSIESQMADKLVFQTVQIFSGCISPQYKQQNLTASHRIARDLQISNRVHLSELYREWKPGMRNMIILHKEFDVCENETNLLKTFINLMLDEKYFVRVPDASYMMSSIAAIFVYTADTMATRLQSLVHGIPVFHTSILREWWIARRHGRVEAIKTVAKNFKWRNVLLIHVPDGNYINHDYFLQSIQVFKEERLCVHSLKINETSTNIVDKTMFSKEWLIHNKPAILVFGDNIDEYTISNMKTFASLNLSIFTHDSLVSTQSHPINFDYIRLLDLFMYSIQIYVKDIPEHLHYLPDDVKLSHFCKFRVYFQDYFTEIAYMTNFVNGKLLFRYAESVKQYMARRLKYEGDFRFSSDSPPISLSFYEKGKINLKKISYFQTYGEVISKLNQQSIGTLKHNSSFVKAAYCPQLNCKPGFYKSYGNVSNGYTWKCEPCPMNYYKSEFGNNVCQLCSGKLSVSNAERTGCLDPYTEQLELTQERFFVIGVSCLGIIATLLTLGVFVKRRNSPIVSLSDYKLSVIHLILILLIFGDVAFSLLWQQKTYGVCVLNLLFISIAYVCSVGVVFIKSQKLLQAFLSRVRLTSKEIQRTVMVQIFIVLVFVTSVNCVLAIFIYQVPIRVLEFEDHEKMTRQHFCNASRHISSVIASAMVIQLLCSIQAFRGRNLPSVMNDGVILTYATFALTIVFGVTFPIVLFQQEMNKEVFQLGAIALNNFIISFLMYGQKAIRMLAYPERNTREYFQAQRMARVNGQITTSH